MDKWLEQLKYSPLPLLASSSNIAIKYHVKKNLLIGEPDSLEKIWEMKQVTRLLKKQQADGSWRYPNPKEDIRSIQDYNQVETFRNLAILIEKYLLNRNHPAIEAAAEFLFGCQTEEGDFRGIYWDQYTPNYSAAFMELLIKSGYNNDSRIKLGLEWLLSIRQDDGAWVIPFRTANLSLKEAMSDSEPVQPDRSKPSSHMVTGVVLRSFAAHPKYKEKPDVRKAGELLASRIFKADNYTDRKAVDFWTRFSFPFWFTDLLSALDSLSQLGMSSKHPGIREGLDWFIGNQQPHGLWNLKLVRGGGDKSQNQWVGFAVCRMLKRLLA